MLKQDLIAKIQAKVGFKDIISDELAPDSPDVTETNKIEKRFFKVATINADDTAGITFVFYLFDTVTGEAWFYNVEPEAVDIKEPNTDQKKLDALQAYLKANFDAYFTLRWDLVNNWAEADTYKVESGALKAQKVMVFKRGTNPITHLNIV